MNLSAIFSKTGKGVQESSGKTSHLSRGDRAVLSAIDGKTPLAEVQGKFEKLAGPKFEALIQQLDKDGFIREVSSGSSAAAPARTSAAARPAAPPPKAPAADESDGLDFTQAIKIPPRAPAPAAPKAPPVDLAAMGRADAERKAKEQAAIDYKTRQEAEVRAKAEADQKAKAAAEARAKAEAESRARAEAEAKAREAAEAKGRADAEAKAKAEAESRARADADAKTRAEAEAKVKAAREAAVRMATEAKAKAEADAKQKTEAAERDKARLEAELNAKLDAERKAREDAEKRAAEAAERARREMEEKAKRDEEIMRQRLEEEMKAKLEAERKAREEEDRKRREEDEKRRAEEDRRRKEEDERRAKEDAERKAREEEDRKRREEEDRKRREEDEKRRAEEARRRQEEEERRAKEEAERKAREEEDRKRREEEEKRRAKEEAERKAEAERRAKEDAERRALEDTNRRLETERLAREEADKRAKEEADRKAKDDAERRAKEDAERRAKEDADRRAREDAERKAKEEAERKAKEEAEAKARAAAAATTSLPTIEAVAPPAPPPAAAAPAGGFGDSLLADLDSFGKREEEEQKAKEEAERKAKAEAERKAKEEAERKAREEAEQKRREEEERRRKEEEERRAKEEEERLSREEEDRRKEEEAERKRKAKEALAAKAAEERAAKAAAARGASKPGAKTDDDDISVSEEDLDTDDLKRDQKVVADKARKAAREAPPVVVSTGRPKKWGKPAAIALFVLLVVGVGVLNVMPISTAEYEKAASDTLGVPVKISSARLAVLTGVEVKLEGVSIGSAVKIRTVRGTPEVGSLFGPRKAFARIDLDGVTVSQSQLADALLGKVSGENMRVGRITAKQIAFEGPLKVPPFDIDATVAGDGTLQTVKLIGPDKLLVTLSPKGGDIGFEISAGSFPLPFLPALSLSEFGMKGNANRTGVVSSEFDGRAFDGVISGTARIRWGDSWTVDGELRARNVKVAVFAPTLVSEGRIEGRGAYNMTGTAPATLYEGARLQGEFKIEKGVLGSFDLARAFQTGGAQSGGRTIFNEMTGQGLWDKGTVQFTNVSISAGAMNAGASLNVDASGNLNGRIVADLKTSSQTQRATLNISGKVQDPVIRK